VWISRRIILTRCYSCDKMKKNEKGGHLARMGEGELRTEFRWGNLRERNYLEYLGVEGKMILKWIFKK